MNMSLAEQRVMLSMMAKKFQWSLPKDSIHKDGMFVEGIDVMGPKDLILEFTKRYWADTACQELAFKITGKNFKGYISHYIVEINMIGNMGLLH